MHLLYAGSVWNGQWNSTTLHFRVAATLVLIVHTAITDMIRVYGKCGAPVNFSSNYHMRPDSAVLHTYVLASQSLPIVLASI